MYGFVNSALEKLVCRRFGREKWEEIRQRANIYLGERATFLINTVYRDEDTYVLVEAASEVLGLDAGTLLEMFGEQFLVWCKESGYAKTLQRLGRSLQDFLTNLDALHDHLSIIYPQMDAPSFRCTDGGSETEFHLHYYSNRDGLENIVKGIVKTVAREFYGVEVSMKLLKPKGEGQDHSLFYIKEVAYYGEQRLSDPTHFVESDSKEQLISAKSFCKCFPFHIIFNRDMTMLQVGSSLAWIIPGWNQSGKCLPSFFALERPRMRLTFTNILSHINTIFILRLTSHSQVNLAYPTTASDPMRLRGQMIYLPESNCMLFLCSPRVSSIHDLDQRGLYLSDIPVHDATRGLLMMSQTAQSEFHHVVQLEEVIGKLNVAQRSLEEEKGRMRDLLHQMLPVSIADSLMAGKMIEAERFDNVTILFSDIVGFTSICGKCEPIQIVSMLNKLYTMFDQVIGTNRVYKVETIGDAYMVVGGLPEKNPVHAECVANQALDMMYYCKQVVRPDSGEPIKMRIGIHSGEVVAGIVGRRMPRYCLFGNAVNIASRTESNGEPGKIQVTETTYKLLSRKPNFIFSVRGPLQFKNVPEPMMCYFLEDNADKIDYQILDVPDEITYDFMQTTDSPPDTPYVYGSGLPSISMTPVEITFKQFPPIEPTSPLKSAFSNKPTSPLKRFLPFTPEVNIINPTPDHSPHPSPPSSSSFLHNFPLACPFKETQENSSRKTSVESNTSQYTETGSITTESELSCDEIQSSVIFSSLETSPGLVTLSSSNGKHSDPSHLIQSVIKNLECHENNGFSTLKEDSPVRNIKEEGLPKVTSEPAFSTQNELVKPKRASSVDRNNRSFSLTSESGDEETVSTPTSPSHTHSVLYVRPRSTSMSERVKFFEANNRNRRTGLSTTYLHGSSTVQEEPLPNGDI